MAKRKADEQDEVALDEQESASVGIEVASDSSPVEQVSAAPAAVPQVTSWYRVHLSAETHVELNPFAVEAATEGEARAKFLAANGIDRSVHTMTIDEVGQSEAQQIVSAAHEAAQARREAAKAIKPAG